MAEIIAFLQAQPHGMRVRPEIVSPASHRNGHAGGNGHEGETVSAAPARRTVGVIVPDADSAALSAKYNLPPDTIWERGVPLLAHHPDDLVYDEDIIQRVQDFLHEEEVQHCLNLAKLVSPPPASPEEVRSYAD